MATATFQGIYNTTTKEYLDSRYDADDIQKMMDEDKSNFGSLVGVIHDNEGRRELTFVCYGEGPHDLFPKSWTKYWGEPEPMTDAEVIEDLISHSSEEFRIDDPDFWTGCPYKTTYPKNEAVHA